jgi:hypothetical protein
MSLVQIRNDIHNLFHRPVSAPPPPSNLHIALLVDDTGGVLTEKAAEDNYARVAYAQGEPTSGVASNPAVYTFPDPTTSYFIIGIALVEGSVIGSGRFWGAIIYDKPRTITSSSRTIDVGQLVSKGTVEGAVS